MNTAAPRSAVLLLAAALLGLGACHSAAPAAPSGEPSFASPAAATDALDHALQAGDQTALLRILGPGGQNLANSGDPAQDKDNHQQFVAHYQQMHRFVTNPNGSVTLIIGAENWPFPIPLVQHAGQWHFDSTAGAQEVLDRRIGRNEAAATAVCQQLIAAQNDYRARMHAYAQHFVSDPGTHDGLFWSDGSAVTANPAPGSPIGPLLAFASVQGAAKAKRSPTPFHGYYYRMAKGQAPGTYAFVAYPALYRSSGVMTFWVNQDGTILQADLGPDSATAAKALTAANPGTGWQKVEPAS